MSTIEISVPDIGDFKNVPVIEVLVKPGDVVKVDDPIVTLEATRRRMDVPSPAAGTVEEVKVKVGDKVSRGQRHPRRSTRRLRASPAAAAAAPAASRRSARRRRPQRRQGRSARRGARARRRPGRLHGGLPRRRPRQEGRAGRALADARRRLPQRRLHPVEGAAARGQGDRRGRRHGRITASPSARRTIDIDKLRGWKDGVVKKLTGGLAGLAKARKVTVVHGHRANSSRPTRSRSTATTAQEAHQLRARDHRRRLRAGARCRSFRTTTRA